METMNTLNTKSTAQPPYLRGIRSNPSTPSGVSAQSNSEFGHDRVTFSDEASSVLAQAYAPPSALQRAGQGVQDFGRGAWSNIRASAIGGHMAGNAIGQGTGPVAPLAAPITSALAATVGLVVGIVTSPIIGGISTLEPSLADDLGQFADSNDPLRGGHALPLFSPPGSSPGNSPSPYFLNPVHPLYSR